MDPYSISKLSAKYQLCAIHTADNTDGKVTGGGKNFTAGKNYHDTGTGKGGFVRGTVSFVSTKKGASKNYQARSNAEEVEPQAGKAAGA